MFSWINKQGVRSTEGFEVQRIGRFQIQYREGNRLATITIESGTHKGKPIISIEPDAFSQWDNGDVVSADKKTQMLERFLAAMKFKGFEVSNG